jgi:hypothetical protein
MSHTRSITVVSETPKRIVNVNRLESKTDRKMQAFVVVVDVFIEKIFGCCLIDLKKRFFFGVRGCCTF